MSHQILMLGGRRAGKSSILATILYSLGENMPGNLCSVTDQTDYTSSDGLSVPLHAKRIEIDNYLRTRQKVGTNSNFMVDMSPSKSQSTYSLATQIGGCSGVYFDFVDVPGEWMASTSQGHNPLIELVTKSDIFVIAIDTPYLMQEENENINTVYNRIEEITNVLANIKINNESDRKLIILCPVKCEKWTQDNKGEQVADKACVAYKKLINNWVTHPSVDIWVMPIETAGGIVHTKLLDGYRVFKSERDRSGELCSINDMTGQIMLKDGKIISQSAVYQIESAPDKSLFIDFTQLPLSWYATNGQGFTPKLCEQPAYHILSFLVKKEQEIALIQKRKIDNSPWWIRWLKELWSPPFGIYLNAYSELISKFEKQHLIKTQGDGFRKIESLIN